MFNKEPTFFKLIYVFREEEDFIIKEHKRLVNGIWSSKKKLIGGRADEKDNVVKYHKEIIDKLLEEGTPKKEIINEWMKCLKKCGKD